MEDFEQNGDKLMVITNEDEFNIAMTRIEFLKQKGHDETQEVELLELALLMKAVEDYEKKMGSKPSGEKEK